MKDSHNLWREKGAESAFIGTIWTQKIRYQTNVKSQKRDQAKY